MPRRRNVLDPRLYGHAPVEKDVHDGAVYLTLAGVLLHLGISEDTMRRHHGALFRQRIQLAPRVFRWRVADVDAYMDALHAQQHAAEAAAAARRAERVERLANRPAPSATTRREMAALSDKRRMALANYNRGG